MHVLVLGGTGAMGVELVQILAENDVKVDVTTRRTHKSTCSNLQYIIGDAHDSIFLHSILSIHYDCIIDFMNYTKAEFYEHRDLMLNATNQYVFLSSARVYANSNTPITEKSPRLLDVCNDKTYLQTDEYALTKARQENMLIESDLKNWTIVRPYITYNYERLQLGKLEKERWLYRALKGRSIVFTKDIASKITTLTYGYDVSLIISKLIGNPKAIGQVFQIASPISIKWEQVLNIYLKTIEKATGKRPNVKLENDSTGLIEQLDGSYQVKYDRLFNRTFDNRKILEVCESNISYMTPELGLEKCLSTFIKNNLSFNEIDWEWEAYADRLTGEVAKLKEIKGFKLKMVYLLRRYLPWCFKCVQNAHKVIVNYKRSN